MFGLNFGKNIFVGIDIGTSSIKMVEIELASGKPLLSNYACMALPNSSGKNDLSPAYLEGILLDCIKEIVRESKIFGKDAFLSIPAAQGLITLIEFPEMSPQEMDQAVKFEAHKYIPASLEEVVISWDVVGQSEKTTPDSKNKIQILLVAAAKNKVEKYEKLVKNLGMNLKSIELESFPMARSLIGNDLGTFVVIDIGFRVCNIILVEKGVVKANRNIDAGGKDINTAISRSMGVDEERSEKLKISGKNFFANDSYINFPVLEVISGETSRLVKTYLESTNQGRIDSVILSGGTANLFGITDYFSKTLNIKTVVGNPFSRVNYEKRLEPILKKMGSQFSVGVGLALKGVEEYLKKNK